jgi:hypothetical protein
MSRQFRHRVTAVVLGGLVVGAPLVMSGTASAGQVAGGQHQMIFGGGGVFGFYCRSSPDAESMTVPAAGTVLVVNRTGHDARLLLDGVDRGRLRHDSATPVMFRRGTTAVAVDPDCSLDDDAASVMVTASPAPADADPGPTDSDTWTPNDPASAEEPAVDSGPIGPAPDAPAGAAQQLPATVKHGGGTRAGKVWRDAERVAPRIRPPAGAPARAKTKAAQRTAGAVPSTVAVRPAGSGQVPASGVPKLALPPVPAEPALAPSQVAAAEPVAAARPLPPERPIGLLALVAAVCVVGVGAAAIRAFNAQRAYRARMT